MDGGREKEILEEDEGCISERVEGKGRVERYEGQDKGGAGRDKKKER